MLLYTATRSISHQESNLSSSSDSSLLYSPYVHVSSGPSDFDATNRFTQIRERLTVFDKVSVWGHICNIK